MAQKITTGTRCTVLGRPAAIVAVHADGFLACRIDGEERIDVWHPSHVAIAAPAFRRSSRQRIAIVEVAS
jgi:hypothetical protein